MTGSEPPSEINEIKIPDDAVKIGDTAVLNDSQGWSYTCLLYTSQKLKRAELLEIMLNLQSENDRLKSENEKLKLAVNERSITLQDAGNIAEAALQLNGVFKAAQEAADVYIENIRTVSYTHLGAFGNFRAAFRMH